MAIKGYTTKKSVSQTISEIQSMLARAGAGQVLVEYEGGRPIALSFLLVIQDDVVPFRLRPRPGAILKSLRQDKVEKRYQTGEQAERVAWRLFREWLDVQLAFVKAGQAALSQLLLGDAIHQSGQTFFELLMEGEARTKFLSSHL